MNYRIANCVLMFVFVVGALPASRGLAQFGDLTRRIPDGANTIILINVDNLHNSQLGKKEGWRENHEKAFAAGVAMIPPQASKYVSAAKLDFNTMQPDWQIALMTLRYEPFMPKVALRYQGTVDKIQSRDVAVLPGDMYVVKFSPTTVGVGSPANRQDVSRWMNRIYNNSLRGLSDYLKEAQKFAQQNSAISMAIDLTDVLPVAEVRERLGSLKALEGKDLDLDKMSKQLASIRGVTLGITVDKERFGAIRVDFGEDVSSLKDLAKPILLEALANNGVMIDEFKDWDVKVSGNRIQIQGILYQSGMRRILSLLDAPPSLQAAAQQVNVDDPKSQEKLKVLASQQYYKSVVSLVDDLRGDKKSRKTMGQIGVWFGKYSTRIDRLPMLNVDTDLIGFGKFVSDSLRKGQGEVQNAAVRSRISQQQVPDQYDISTYSNVIGVSRGRAVGWSGWHATSNAARTANLRTQARTKERLRGNVSANQVLSNIAEATATIRQHMTQKYNVEF